MDIFFYSCGVPDVYPEQIQTQQEISEMAYLITKSRYGGPKCQSHAQPDEGILESWIHACI